MRKIAIWGVVALMVVAIAAVPALAVTPTSTTRDGGLQFRGAPVLTDQGNTLLVTGEVSGAGTAGTASLSATATFTAGCVTRGGGEPQGLEELESNVIGEAELDITRQGRGTFSVTTEPVTLEGTDFNCPSRQQQEVIVGNDVDFTNIVLTVESQTGTVTATFPDQIN
jgi:hypothetical protein